MAGRGTVDGDPVLAGEVVAVNYLPDLRSRFRMERARALIDADGPTGAPTAVILAYFVAWPDREAGPLQFADGGTGAPSIEAVGRQHAPLIRRTHVGPRPVVALLDETARYVRTRKRGA
ncbi:hypothetical protein [Nonomuraea sp. 10N515B]|uniref:hypothetical protein n=1 Tax=Nonomuraea sp. 10N515B TaxID=3457422 RepID=UPI003FCC7B33